MATSSLHLEHPSPTNTFFCKRAAALKDGRVDLAQS
jgi:hypothetical protein